MGICLCGYGQEVNFEWHNYVHGHNRRNSIVKEKESQLTLCLCGCGELLVRNDWKYNFGHKKKYLESLPDKLCKCGCGTIIKGYQKFVQSHIWTGKTHTEETKKLISKTKNENKKNQKIKLNYIKKIKIPKMQTLCLCGCGMLTNNGKKYIKWHNFGSSNLGCNEQQLSYDRKDIRKIHINTKKLKACCDFDHNAIVSYKPHIIINLIRNSDFSNICKQKTKEIASKKQSIMMKERWKDHNFANKMIASFNGVKNKAEIDLELIINEIYPNKYKYVGNRSFWIGRMNPDFICDKKIIEMYDDWFHRNDNPQDRINNFKNYGYDALIIWQHELYNSDLLKQKITNFHENNVNSYEFSTRIV